VIALRSARRVLVGLGGCILVAGCTSPQQELSRSDDGPLSVGGIVGGVSVNEPREDPWRASFGTFFLCTEDGATVHLEDVRAPGDPAPRAVRAVLHAKREGAAASPERFGSRLGSPPDWDEPYVEGPTRRQAASVYTDDIQGEVVDEPCPTSPAGDRFTELVVTLEAGEAGADVKRFFVDYRVDETKYTLPVDWQLIMCGAQVVRHCG